MVPGLEEVDAFVSDQIDDAVLLRQAPRPHVGAEIFDGFGLADSLKGISAHRLDEIEAAQRGLPVGRDPVSQVFEELLLENRYSLPLTGAPGQGPTRA